MKYCFRCLIKTTVLLQRRRNNQLHDENNDQLEIRRYDEKGTLKGSKTTIRDLQTREMLTSSQKNEKAYTSWKQTLKKLVKYCVIYGDHFQWFNKWQLAKDGTKFNQVMID